MSTQLRCFTRLHLTFGAAGRPIRRPVHICLFFSFSLGLFYSAYVPFVASSGILTGANPRISEFPSWDTRWHGFLIPVLGGVEGHLGKDAYTCWVAREKGMYVILYSPFSPSVRRHIFQV